MMVNIMKNIKAIYILPVLCTLYLESKCLAHEINLREDQWNLRWFPQPMGETDHNEIMDYQVIPDRLRDDKHGVLMGVPFVGCDNGKVNLQQDWLDDPRNYTCYESKMLYLPRNNIKPLFFEDHIPPFYVAQHVCMNGPINYRDEVPSFGMHRPLWAKYGEYRFLPKQRWLHNLEHGAIAMLYHPCANKREVNLLRHLVTNCLYRHVITPYNMLSPERPLVLVAWGKKLFMSKVDPALVVLFIKFAAKHGPEALSNDGQYDYELLEHARVITTLDDNVLCPKFTNIDTMA